MRRLLSLQDDVEDRVMAVGAAERAAKLALGDRDRMRLLATSVEDTGNESLSAQARGGSRAHALALLCLQLDSLSSHGGLW